MNDYTPENEESETWQVKRLLVCFGGLDDAEGFVTLEIFDDAAFGMREGDGTNPPKWMYEEINLNAARMIRDFLNYALDGKARGA